MTTVALACLGALAPRATAQAAPQPQRREAAESLLVDEIRRQIMLWPFGPSANANRLAAFRPAQVQFSGRALSGIPSVTLRWAAFSPPWSERSVVRALVVSAADDSRLVRDASEWAGLRIRAVQLPADTNTALATCFDMAGASALVRGGSTDVVPYASGQSLPGLRTIGDSTLRARLQPPAVGHSPTRGWSVHFWQLEVHETSMYECELGPQRLSLRRLETLHEAGLMANH